VKKQKEPPIFENKDIKTLDRLQSQDKNIKFGVDVVEIFDYYLNLYHKTKNPEYLDAGHAINKYTFDYFYGHIGVFKTGVDIDIDLPFELAERSGRKKLCFLKCSHCGDYFIKFSHHAILCRACRVVRKSDAQKERRLRMRKQRKVKRCLNCGKRIQEGLTAKKEYCSGRCRTAACRKRVTVSAS